MIGAQIAVGILVGMRAMIPMIPTVAVTAMIAMILMPAMKPMIAMATMIGMVPVLALIAMRPMIAMTAIISMIANTALIAIIASMRVVGTSVVSTSDSLHHGWYQSYDSYTTNGCYDRDDSYQIYHSQGETGVNLCCTHKWLPPLQLI